MEMKRRTDQPLRVVLVDDHPLMRSSVRRSIEDSGNAEVVAQVGTGAEALSVVKRTNPDVVLLDLMLPDMDGFEVLRAMRRNRCPASVVILTGVGGTHTAQAAREAGASGYLTKDRATSSTLAEVVRTARPGLFVMDQQSMADIVEQTAQSGDAGFRLTPREREVWLLVTRGLSNAGIAKSLCISERTAKFHVGNLLTKTGSRSRSEAAAHAYRLGVVPAMHDRRSPANTAV